MKTFNLTDLQLIADSFDCLELFFSKKNAFNSIIKDSKVGYDCLQEYFRLTNKVRYGYKATKFEKDYMEFVNSQLEAI